MRIPKTSHNFTSNSFSCIQGGKRLLCFIVNTTNWFLTTKCRRLPDFYSDLVHKFRKNVGKPEFSDHFSKIVRCYEGNGYITLTLVLLDPDIPCLCKQCRSRSVGF